MDRRTFVKAAAALASAPALADAATRPGLRRFPANFLWGAATAAHQTEGNNVNSDSWLLENVKPTIFHEPSGDAADSFHLWPRDLDIVRSLDLNSYRFSLEWARIEPEEGFFSIAMLDHYKAMVHGCRTRGLTPVVTFNHFTTPRWFAGSGGWTNPRAPDLFARFCERAARHLGSEIGHAITLNEPNLPQQLIATIPRFALLAKPFAAMAAAAAKASGSSDFVFGAFAPADIAARSLPIQIAAHRAGRRAIKSVLPQLPVGVSLAIADEQAVGSTTKRDAVRAQAYGAWLDAVRGEDFVGVQNYTRNRWSDVGKLPAPAKAVLNHSGDEVHASSLAGAVRYAYEASGCPVMVTEHGVGTDDDAVRAALIRAALEELRAAMDGGLPVLGYLHWSLIDNFEWVAGYGPKFGLCAVDRTTFRRTPKPSAAVLKSIARQNAI